MRGVDTMRGCLQNNGRILPEHRSPAPSDRAASGTPPGPYSTYLDVPVDEMAIVHDLHAFQYLVCELQHSSEGKAAATLVEQILQRVTQQLHYHHVVAIELPKIVDFAKACAMLKFSIDLVFMAKLRASCAMLFEFDGHLLTRGDILPEVYVTK